MNQSPNSLAQKIANLSPAQRLLLEKKLQQRRLPSPPGIPHHPHLDPVPLSFAQKRLWFLDQLEGQSAMYNMFLAFRLRGKLHISALTQALQQVGDRHQILKINFEQAQGEPRIQYHGDRGFKIPLVDLTNLSEPEKSRKVQLLIETEAQTPFNLAKDPLLRACLWQLESEDHILSITQHHSISDGISLNIFQRELAHFYHCILTKSPPDLVPLPIQYGDYALWQTEHFTTQTYQKQLAYWLKKLADSPPLLALPTDYPRPAIQTYGGAKLTQVLDTNLETCLRSLGHQEGATLFMVLLAAFKIFLAKQTGQEDIIVGTPHAGRDRLETEPLIGLFINTLVLRTAVKGDQDFRAFLNQVKETVIGAFEHQDVQFETLVDNLKIERNLSHNPLFQVWFNMLTLESEELTLTGLDVEKIEQKDIASSKFDLTLYIRTKDNQLHLTWLYNTALFTAETITFWSQQFTTLLHQISTHPAQSIDRLSLLPSTFPSPLPIAHSPHPLSLDQSLPQQFRAIVQQHPHHWAIITPHHQWTYGQLQQQVTAIAKALIQHLGISEERIALLYEHGAPMVAAMMGVLTAGKAYVALDPTYPQERLTFILQDAQVAGLLTSDENAEMAVHLMAQTASPGVIINTDRLGDTVKTVNNQRDDRNHDLDTLPPVAPDALAYVLYTSGSTGQPKGVRQTHRNILHFIQSHTHQLAITDQDRISLIASYSFDAAVVDIYSALLNGATLYPLNVKVLKPQEIVQALETSAITLFHSTPTFYRYLVDYLQQQFPNAVNLFPSLRAVILGGEAMTQADLTAFNHLFSPDCTLINLYGSSESSISAYYVLTPQSSITTPAIPLGYPTLDTEILLLNATSDHPQVYGEITLKSAYVTPGYWQRPDLNATVFTPTPDGQQLYRTGDYGRLQADGSLVFLGRKDFQIKLRGYRIELEEIESVLLRHPAVKQAVILRHDPASGDPFLVAYLGIPDHSLPPSSTPQWRAYLQTQLPDFLIPQRFMVLPALPLTPNGKIDRRALPTPDPETHPSAQGEQPATDLEKRIAQVWQTFLPEVAIHRHSNFFDLGGHSLLAVKVVMALENLCERTIPLTDLFRYPTLADLAHHLSQFSHSSVQTPVTNPHLIPIQPQGSEPPLFAIHSLGVGCKFYRPLGAYLTPTRPLVGVNLQFTSPLPRRHRSIQEFATQYAADIIAHQPQGPYHLIGYSIGGLVAFEVANLLVAQGKTVAFLALIDSAFPVKNRPAMPPESFPWQDWFNPPIIQSRLRKQYYRLINTLRYQKYIGRNFTDLPVSLQQYAYLRENVKARRHHRLVTPYPHPVLFIKAAQTPPSYVQGWSHWVGGRFILEEVPGSHQLLLQEAHIQTTAAVITHYLFQGLS